MNVHSRQSGGSDDLLGTTNNTLVFGEDDDDEHVVQFFSDSYGNDAVDAATYRNGPADHVPSRNRPHRVVLHNKTTQTNAEDTVLPKLIVARRPPRATRQNKTTTRDVEAAAGNQLVTRSPMLAAARESPSQTTGIRFFTYSKPLPPQQRRSSLLKNVDVKNFLILSLPQTTLDVTNLLATCEPPATKSASLADVIERGRSSSTNRVVSGSQQHNTSSFVHYTSSSSDGASDSKSNCITRKRDRADYERIVGILNGFIVASGQEVPKSFSYKRLPKTLPLVTCQPVQILTSANDNAFDSLYVVRAGVVEVIAKSDTARGTVDGGEQVLDCYESGDYFGELPLLFDNELQYDADFRASCTQPTQCIQISYKIVRDTLCKLQPLRPCAGVFDWLQRRAIVTGVSKDAGFQWQIQKHAITSALLKLKMFNILPPEAFEALLTSYEQEIRSCGSAATLLTRYQHGESILKFDDVKQFVIIIKGSAVLASGLPDGLLKKLAGCTLRATPQCPVVFGEAIALAHHHQHHHSSPSQRDNTTTDDASPKHAVELQALGFAYCIVLDKSSVLHRAEVDSVEFHHYRHERKYAWHLYRKQCGEKLQNSPLCQIEIIVHILLHAMRPYCTEGEPVLIRAWPILRTQLYEFLLTQRIVPHTVDENAVVISDKKELKSATLLVLDGQLELWKNKQNERKQKKPIKTYDAGALFWKADRLLYGEQLVATVTTTMFVAFNSEMLDELIRYTAALNSLH